MKKKAARNVFFDRVHKGGVYFCLALSVWAGIGLGVKVYEYYTIVKPELDRKQLIAKQNLLQEGAADKSLYESNITLKE
uniref:Putative cytochrome oxidase c assembly n=1 Tax=Xenopsylla cheopis TaxID=163159 RepID=A0A6M2DNE7_XENCH